MALDNAAFTGTKSVSTTEWSLTADSAGPVADTTAGVFSVWVDLNAVAAGDVFQLKIYEKVRSGDTQRVVDTKLFSGAQISPIWTSAPLQLGIGWDITLLKVSGTDRTINWSIRSVS